MTRIRPLDGPLLSGRPERLWMLDYGLFRVLSDPSRDIVLPGWLIETDRGERVLVDLGLPSRYAADPGGAGQQDGLDAFGHCLAFGPEHLPAARLARLGIGAAAIDVVLLTHTHIDHAGDLSLEGARDVPWIIGAAERALIRPLPLFGSPPDWPDRDWRTVTGETDLAPGVTVLPAPGHAPGQLALLVGLPGGPVLLTSDAASRPAEVEGGFEGHGGARDRARISAAALLDRAAAEGATVLWGHCPAQGPRLLGGSVTALDGDDPRAIRRG